MSLRAAIKASTLIIVVAPILAVGTSGCTPDKMEGSSESASVPLSESANSPVSPDGFGISDAQRQELYRLVSTSDGVVDCEGATSSDILQSPFPILTATCGRLAEGGVQFYVASSAEDLTFVAGYAQTGEGHSFTYLTEADWVAIGRTEVLSELQPTLSGTMYSTPEEFDSSIPNPVEMERLLNCQQLYTAAAANFGAKESDAVEQLDTVAPGINELFQDNIRSQVEELPGFGDGDELQILEEMESLAPIFRSHCSQIISGS